MSVRALYRAVAPAVAIFLVAGCVFALAYYHDSKYLAGPPYGAHGSLALADADFDHPIPLVDGWRLSVEGGDEIDTFIGQYSDFSYAPGDAGAFGSATYRLALHYDGAEAERAVVLLIPEVFTDYALYVNGRAVSAQGDGTEVAFTVGADTQLVFEVENRTHYYGGLVYPPVLGSAEAIADVDLANTFATSVLVLVPAAAALFALAVRRRGDGDALVRDFGVLCAALAVAGFHAFAWRLGWTGPWWYAVEDAAWALVLVCALALAARAAGALRQRALRMALRALVIVPVVVFVWVALVIPAAPATIQAYGAFQSVFRVACWSLFVACAALGLINRSAEARFVLYGCAVLGASLIANLLDNNVYEPLYGLWQNEYAALFLVAVFGWMLVERVRRLRAASEQVRDLEVQVRAAETSLTHVRRGEEATRAARHDLRHHVGALRQMADAGEWDRCRAYLDELSEQQQAEAPLRYADNLEVNAVMAAYLSPAQAAGVRVSWDVQVPAALNIKSTELVVLLSNLLSNAVEACERARAATGDAPALTLSMHERAGRLAIRCENTVAPDAAFGATTKPDAEHHGLGLPTMRQVAERHHGALYADIEEHRAIVRIVLMLDSL